MALNLGPPSPDSKSVRLEVDHHGLGTLHVNGIDVGRITTGVEITAHVAQPPTLTHHTTGGAEVVLCTVLSVYAEAGVKLRPEDRAALIALGWTPPEEP